jgi:hypothetical protein
MEQFTSNLPELFNFIGISDLSIFQSQQLYRSDDGLKSFKLCLDGKKVNISSKSLLGGVDHFGFEDKPTVSSIALKQSSRVLSI